MKKYLSVILSLILALAMVFSLVACGSDDNSSDDDDSSSKSSSSQSSSDESETSSEAEVSDEVSTGNSTPDKKPATDSVVGDWEGVVNEGDSSIKVSVTFKSDNTCVMEIDARSYVEDQFKGLDDYLAEEGITLDDYLAEAGYDSFDDMVDSIIEETLEEEGEDAFIENGEYSFDGETFILGEEEYVCEFDGNKITLKYEDAEDFSIELERV